MATDLTSLLKDLAEFGKRNDAVTTERSKKMLNITPETGEFLELIVKAVRARCILEIGTSNGYSTIWLLKGARATGGHITTLEMQSHKIVMATENFRRAGVADLVDLRHTEAGIFLLSESQLFDLIFLDSERNQYVGWWPRLSALMAPGGLLIVDNATSHPAEMADFIALVRESKAFITSLVPIGNGELLAYREP
ncbi:MAG: methyltransferase [Deltaproteobacteria bacterium]|nr:MAG: methyltransferase [Deltaproteobacteria bacterium]